ncbi:MAG: ATP-dependent protease ATPase subunit HslU [Firmicutes bacterium]|nr:ATP-dependent protease ATPase subunit HslU [Bacillota bacterium]
MNQMTPKEIVRELDKYIIGQDKAKKSVAIALRNRYRRSQLPEEIREEITPKNILMMGPTGVGKTEIARRLAKLVDAPFVKVEATKFTEVGYVGRDVDSMIRDLAEASIRITKNKMLQEKYAVAEVLAEEKILDAFIPPKKKPAGGGLRNPFDLFGAMQQNAQNQKNAQNQETQMSDSEIELAREQVRKQLQEGLLEDQLIEIEVEDNSAQMNMLDVGGGMDMSISLGSIFGDAIPKKMKKKKVYVKEARKILKEQEAQNLIDMDRVTSEAMENAEQNGIVFIDEIDKIASSGGFRSGADVSREGVQRDILPIVEGSVVNTKYGPLKTDHILFIGAGAFHVSKPTDLIPELQGRFPIRVELENLTKDVFVQILTQTENAIVKQYKLLLETEGVKVTFTDEAIDAIAETAFLMNEQTENIGARRLHTVMENLLEDVSYNITEHDGEELVIDEAYVKERLEDYSGINEVEKYIL